MKKHKKLIVLIGLLLIVLIGAALWRQLGGADTATANNYSDANKASKQVRDTYQATEKAFNTYEQDITSVENKAAYEKAHQEYVSKVGALKVALDKAGDEKLSDAYGKFKVASDSYTDYTSGFVANISAARDVTNAPCVKFVPSSEDVLAAYDASVKECQLATATLKLSTNAGIAAFAEKLDQALQERRTAIVEAKTKAEAGDGAGFQTALTKALTQKVPDLQDELAAAQQKLGVISAYEEFQKILGEKYSDTLKK